MAIHLLPLLSLPELRGVRAGSINVLRIQDMRDGINMRVQGMQIGVNRARVEITPTLCSVSVIVDSGEVEILGCRQGFPFYSHPSPVNAIQDALDSHVDATPYVSHVLDSQDINTACPYSPCC
jgi:hypothetical protein